MSVEQVGQIDFQRRLQELIVQAGGTYAIGMRIDGEDQEANVTFTSEKGIVTLRVQLDQSPSRRVDTHNLKQLIGQAVYNQKSWHKEFPNAAHNKMWHEAIASGRGCAWLYVSYGKPQTAAHTL